MENKGYNLFLDDLRPISAVSVPRNGYMWKIARDYNSFCEMVKSIYNETGDIPKFISWDHDLDEEHYRPSMYNPDEHYTNYYTDGTFTKKTGYDCALWLIDFCIQNNLKMCEYQVHSMNPIGKKNIISVLERFKKIQNYEQ